MKKLLLLTLAACGATALNAMEPLTAEQLAAFTCQVDMNADGSFYSSSADVHMEYAEGKNTEIKISGFNYGEDSDVQTLYVNWEEGTVSISAMYYGYPHYDEDNNSYYYNFAVNPQAAELSGPMDPSFTSSKIAGKISEDGIELEPWMLVKVAAPDFQSMEKGFSQPISTKYVKPNATMSVKRLEWDSDWENLLPYSQVDLDGNEYPDRRIYTEVNDADVTIYHWDDNPSCVVFNQKIEDGNTYYTTPADRTIYLQKGKNPYVLCQLPGLTWDDYDNLSADNAKALVSDAVTDKNKLSFGSWITINLGKSKNERTCASACTVTFDKPLPVGSSGIAEETVAETPVKVTYFNLCGVEVSNPDHGMFIKVATYASGKTVATKIVK